MRNRRQAVYGHHDQTVHSENDKLRLQDDVIGSSKSAV